MTLYDYQIRVNKDGTTELVEKVDSKKFKMIVRTYENANDKPVVAACLLRDLAKWAIEQAEIIEDMEGIKKTPDREPFSDTLAVLIDRDILAYRNVAMCGTVEVTRGYNEAMRRVREYIGMED